jgi:predicted PurR-regulated permease PerM
MLVILLGVIGGTVTYGLIGPFLGPVLLGIFNELLMAWVKDETPRLGKGGNGMNAIPPP